MDKNYTYFIEKTSILLFYLLIGEGNAKKRLLENRILISIAIDDAQVPETLKPMRDEILKILTTVPAVEENGVILQNSMSRTISKMRNSTASKVITMINQLYDEVKHYNIEE